MLKYIGELAKTTDERAMNSEEARMLQDLAFPVVEHEVVIPLPSSNLLSIPIVSFYVTVKNGNGEMAYSRQATRRRMIPATSPAEPDNWMDVLRQIQVWVWNGNIKLVSLGSSGAQRNRYFLKRLRYDLGRHHRQNKKKAE